MRQLTATEQQQAELIGQKTAAFYSIRIERMLTANKWRLWVAGKLVAIYSDHQSAQTAADSYR